MTQANEVLDIKGEVCPYTLVKSKLALEGMESGQILEVLLDHEPATVNVPQSLHNEGHEILGLEKLGENDWKLRVKKK